MRGLFLFLALILILLGGGWLFFRLRRNQNDSMALVNNLAQQVASLPPVLPATTHPATPPVDIQTQIGTYLSAHPQPVVISPADVGQAIAAYLSAHPLASDVLYQLPLDAVSDLTIPQSQHLIPRPNLVRVTNEDGVQILLDTRIDPVNQTVRIHASKPVTGFLYIS